MRGMNAKERFELIKSVGLGKLGDLDFLMSLVDRAVEVAVNNDATLGLSVEIPSGMTEKQAYKGIKNEIRNKVWSEINKAMQ